LLVAPQLQNLDGKRVLILRGEGGREVLAEELRLRGADVTYAECYRRVRPRADPTAIISRWERGALQAVTVMSGETLDNLQAMLGSRGQQLLRTTPLFVPHASIAERARHIGLTEVVVTPPGDEGVVRGLCAWFSLRTR
jgi:uroporphyrinogen-III synthase